MNDLISRQTLIDAFKEEFYMMYSDDYNYMIKFFNNLPSAEPRNGKWIEDDDATVRGHCSVCGWESHYYEDDVVGANYCPNCGARMGE